MYLNIPSNYITENGIKLGNVKVKYNGEVISNFDLYYNEKDNERQVY